MLCNFAETQNNLSINNHYETEIKKSIGRSVDYHVLCRFSIGG